MNPNDLKDWIDSLAQDIDFSYNGVLGSVCPINRRQIELCYGEETTTARSVEEAMSLPFIDGHSLAEICKQIEI